MTDVESVQTGERYAIAKKTDGTWWSWGANATGYLGFGGGDVTARNTPTEFTANLPANTIDVRAMREDLLAMTSDGWIWAIGTHNATNGVWEQKLNVFA